MLMLSTVAMMPKSVYSIQWPLVDDYFKGHSRWLEYIRKDSFLS